MNTWLEPVNIVLALTLAIIVYVVVKAQSREDFDFADFLRDETGKPSVFRLIAFITAAASIWVLMRYAVNYAVPEWMWQDILIAFSGSATIAKVVEGYVASKRQ